MKRQFPAGGCLFFVLLYTSNVYYNVYKGVYMRTNIVLDDELIKQAFLCAPIIKTKKALIDAALREFIEVRKVKEIKDIRGMDLLADDYDYKAMREQK